MRTTHHVLLRVAAVLWGVLLSGCSAHSLTYCRPGEPSTNCCIRKFSLSPVESCGATLSEVDLVLRDMALVMTVEAATHESAQNAGDDADDDDFANNKDLPEWKQRCIKNYVSCRDGGWTGNCYDCLRYCEGQRDWPFRMCGPRKKR